MLYLRQMISILTGLNKLFKPPEDVVKPETTSAKPSASERH